MSDNTEAESASFSWDDQDVVIRARPGVAVYRNADGNITIRTTEKDDEGNDMLVSIPLEDAEMIAQAIIACAQADS